MTARQLVGRFYRSAAGDVAAVVVALVLVIALAWALSGCQPVTPEQLTPADPCPLVDLGNGTVGHVCP